MKGMTMKLLLGLVSVFFLCANAYAQPQSTVQNNQNSPSVLVPGVHNPPRVEATIMPSRTDYSYGQTVHLIFTVANHTKSAINYEFATSQKFDMIISDNAGKPIWKWSRNRVFGQLYHQMTLNSGESTVYSAYWQQRDNNDTPVPPGTYSVTATFIPIARPKISGNILSNLNNDPVNTGVPMQDNVETGAVAIQNTTPPLSAKTTFTIEPAK
jgi:hypothetical protein